MAAQPLRGLRKFMNYIYLGQSPIFLPNSFMGINMVDRLPPLPSNWAARTPAAQREDGRRPDP